MTRWLIALLLALHAVGAAAQDTDLTTLPQGQGFPLLVRVGLCFVDIKEINENEGTFTAKVDLRLRWRDARLAFPAEKSVTGFVEYLDEAAEKKLSEIWHPQAVFATQVGDPSYQRRGVRIFADGRVELMQRTAADFSADFPLEKFPFDTQKLGVQIVSRLEPVQRVLFDFRQDELEYSSVRYISDLDGWSLGLVELSKSPESAWRGEMNTGVTVAQIVKRNQNSLLATVFVPLFASLLIPLLVLWLNKIENGEFTIDAFELTNISIGGLFAVVALNFTVNSSFVNLAVGDNPVMRLFGLNYAILGVSIAIGILFYRFNGIKRLFGPYIQEELFAYLNWAIPFLVFSSAVAMVAVALY